MEYNHFKKNIAYMLKCKKVITCDLYISLSNLVIFCLRVLEDSCFKKMFNQRRE